MTLQRHAKAKGYFSPERFHGRIEETAAHELAMNPDTFTGRSDEDILSTLAHEMAHVWQQSQGTPPWRSYHARTKLPAPQGWRGPMIAFQLGRINHPAIQYIRKQTNGVAVVTNG